VKQEKNQAGQFEMQLLAYARLRKKEFISSGKIASTLDISAEQEWKTPYPNSEVQGRASLRTSLSFRKGCLRMASSSCSRSATFSSMSGRKLVASASYGLCLQMSSARAFFRLDSEKPPGDVLDQMNLL
jgi:hypothetical protein